MNTLQELQKRCDDLAADLAALQALLENLRARSDPFATHIFTSRRRYRDAGLSDTKSGKRTEYEAWESYGRATKLGFQGSLHDWMRILRVPVPD